MPEILWGMQAAQRVDTVTFLPGESQIVETSEGSAVNQWSGFAIPPHPEPVTNEEVKPFLEYIYKIICSGDPVVYAWIMSWLADIFQDPGNKPGTAVVLVGRAGVGKSFLGENILKPIIGGRHYAQTNTVGNLTSNFNSLYSMRLFLLCDEAIRAGQKAEAEKLKSLITEPDQRVEFKNIDAFTVPSHARLWFTSNHSDKAISIEQGRDDRRLTVLSVSAAKKGQIKEYWMPFVAWLESEGTYAKIHRFLADYKYDKATIKVPLQTAAKDKMQQYSWGPVVAWLAEMDERGHPLSEALHQHWSDAMTAEQVSTPYAMITEIDRSEWPAWIKASTLAEDYRRFVNSNRYRNASMDAAQLMRALRDMGVTFGEKEVMRPRYTHEEWRNGKLVTRKMRPRLVRCFSQYELQAVLRDDYGHESERNEDDASDAQEE